MFQRKRAKAMIANKIGNTTSSDVDTINYDLYLLMRGKHMMPQIEKHWKRTGGYLLKMRDLCQKNNIPFMLVLYPYGIHVGENQWYEGRVHWGFEQGKTYTDYYAFDFIKDFANKNGIPIHNSLENFLANKDTELFWPLDGHMTPAGYEVLAESLSKNEEFREMIRKSQPLPTELQSNSS